MKRWLCLLLLFAGCIKPEPRPVALPAPPPKAPNIQLPMELRYRNWGSGSCVYASICQLLEAHNRHEDAAWIRQHCEGAAGPQEITSVCRRRGIEFDETFRADPGFLDWADKNGYGAIIWWKTRHCCTFMGWVVRDGVTYADILDNNFPERRELVERRRFLNDWARLYGGYALAPMCDLATVVPYPSYELVL